ncbi:MAG: zf-HC2 domain-containing protein [Gemmatimonadetes bacterium]|nr:zf-HC2 domain-containing protein [Gemmatimonadota bacterium]
MSHVDEGTLSAYMDGDDSLTDADVIAIENHLAKCSACQELYGQAKETRKRAASLLEASGPSSIAVPPFEQIVGRARAGEKRTKRTRYQALRKWAVAATVILAVGVGVYSGPQLVQLGKESTSAETAEPSSESLVGQAEPIPVRGEFHEAEPQEAPSLQAPLRDLAAPAEARAAQAAPAAEGGIQARMQLLEDRDDAGVAVAEVAEPRERARAQQHRLERAGGADAVTGAVAQALIDDCPETRLAGKAGFRDEFRGAREPPVRIRCLPVVSVVSEEFRGDTVMVITQEIAENEFVTLRAIDIVPAPELDDFTVETDTLNSAVGRVGRFTVQVTGKVSSDSLGALLRLIR